MSTTSSAAPLVAILGNPNTGKTTLFNALTGLRQRTGNYPGVTVFKKSGTLGLSGAGCVEVLDLPGLYSLAATSPDERVVLDVLAGRLPGLAKPNLILCVADATNLLRNLFLASQVAELGIPMVLVLNHADVIRKRGITLDTAKLSERLGGIPVVSTSAWRGEGIAETKKAIAGALETAPRMRRIEWKPGVAEALEILREGLERTEEPLRSRADSELQRLLFDAVPARSATDTALSADAAPARERLIRAARERIRRDGLNPFAAEAVLHYEHLQRILDGVTTESSAARAVSSRLDAIFLHRAIGPLVFLLAMAVVFAAVFWIAPIPQGWLESLFSWAQSNAGTLLEGSPILQSLVVDGVIAGVGAFAGFLPQILTLFFFVALLEDSGYMARAAFLMDKLFSWCGLNGRSFMPMLSGFACGVPSILATRVIEDPKARAATAFLVPLMSCSARLPVYTLMISAFIVPAIGVSGGVLVMVGMYLLGLVIALPTAFVLTKFFLRSRPQPFVLELPRYQVPSVRDVLVRVWDSGSEFVVRCGTVIFSITVIVWALLYFPHSEETGEAAKTAFIAEIIGEDAGAKAAQAKEGNKPAEAPLTPAAIEALLKKAEEQKDAYEKAVADFTAKAEEAGKEVDAAALKAVLVEKNLDPFAAELAAGLENVLAAAHVENSYMGRFGKIVQPVFAPAGFDWRITVGVLASFPAREAIIATLGTTYSLGTGMDEDSDDLKTALSKARWTEGPNLGKPVFTLAVAFGIMAFFALCSQCGATLAVIRKESGLRWAVASFIYMTTLAWLAAVACYQAGNLFLG